MNTYAKQIHYFTNSSLISHEAINIADLKW